MPNLRPGKGAETRAQDAYSALRADIVHGALAPDQPLRLAQLRLRYGHSFSPLREALNRLESERLVVARPLRGFVVAPFSMDDMLDATRARVLIECEALRLSIARGDAAWERNLVAAFHALDHAVRLQAGADEIEPLHDAFHLALIAACGSPRLLAFAAQLARETQRYRWAALSAAQKGARDLRREHRALMQAALARDGAKACQTLARHYQRTANNLCDQP
jgi:DNA-binding GntR family transcriptional regulator